MSLLSPSYFQSSQFLCTRSKNYGYFRLKYHYRGVPIVAKSSFSVPESGKDSNFSRIVQPQNGKDSNLSGIIVPENEKDSNFGRILVAENGKDSNLRRNSVAENGNESNFRGIMVPENDKDSKFGGILVPENGKDSNLKGISLSENGKDSSLRGIMVTENDEDSNFRGIIEPENGKGSSFGGIMVPESGKDSNLRRIMLSDVVVKRERNVFLGRKWNVLDISTAFMVVFMHLLCVFAPFTFSWRAVIVAAGLYLITGLLGITLSFHRNLSHRSFKLPKWLEYFFAYCGVQALQGNPIDWVRTHRYHHQFCDSEKDPHSPIEGFWFSHMSWLFDTKTVAEKCGNTNNVGDLEKQPFYKFLQSTYIFHPLAFGIILYVVGGFPFVVWGMGVRVVWVYHITWLVNSACHVWGKQSWNTGDLSRNNWWVALLAFGEGWHNNHHAFEYSARHGLEWWQIDMTWYVVWFLQAIGFATDVKLPSHAQKQRMAFSN